MRARRRAAVGRLRCAWAVAACAAAIALGACGADPGEAARGGDTRADVDDAQVIFDTGQPPDTAADTAVVPGGFGAPCSSNKDCTTGWCVEGQSGTLCTKECREECPEDFDCKALANATSDVVFLCIPRLQRLCAPCLDDAQCPGGACLLIDGAGQCASGCDPSGACPEGFLCGADREGAHDGGFCLPESGSCSCTEALAGNQRSCSRGGAGGTCFGVETCRGREGWGACDAREPVAETCNGVDDDCNGLVDDGLPPSRPCSNDVAGVGSCEGLATCYGPAGWVCQAPTPAPETCDFRDNDCDGVTDEGFATGGVYDQDEHCGSCLSSCADGFPNAAATRCLRDGTRAYCVVEACDPGYVKLNAFQCVPDVGSVCQPCAIAAQCLGQGAACVALADGSYCTRSCAGGATCPSGFSCEAVPGAIEPQCMPSSGSCTCDASTPDLSRACSVTYAPSDPNLPSSTCAGIQPCGADGWGACALPPEVCDGLDNDCNGVIDDPFRVDGRYTTVAHCGACGINCASVSHANASPVCRTDGAVPRCGYACTGGAVDVNGLSDDGCECLPVPGADLAGDGLDSNCDGVDGDVTRGIFVSRDGDDAALGTREAPVRTITRGLERAAGAHKRDVYVATGVYAESVALKAGIGVFGGYSPDFSEREPLLYETAILGGTPTTNLLGTVVAVGLGRAQQGPTTLDGFTVFGVNAANLPSTNSYAIYLRNVGAGLSIRNNRVVGGPGGSGAPGAPGGSGAHGVDGGRGSDAHDTDAYALPFAYCAQAHERTGGSGGALTCGATEVTGGLGGYADCPSYGTPPPSVNMGRVGRGPAGGSGGGPGWDAKFCTDTATPGCPDCNSCFTPPNDNRGSGEDGHDGADGADGSRGLGCQSPAGTVVAGEWRGISGGDGGAGLPGGGGGGGGSGGGVYLSGSACLGDAGGLGSDDVGGSGGGGGSGGCGATGAKGGRAGGGSFGIFLANDSAGDKPTIAGNEVRRGMGGTGGAGGPGGVGGPGGAGGSGGLPGDVLTGLAYRKTWCANGGGAGGDGGDGGHGGGGGGGCGGASFGIYVSAPDGTPAAYATSNAFSAGGAGGSGGQAGPSLGHGAQADMIGAGGAEEDVH